MNKKNTRISDKKTSLSGTSELDTEMREYLSKKNVPPERIDEFKKIRCIISEHISVGDYSFSPFFTEQLVHRIPQNAGNHLIPDISYTLSLFLKRVMLATLVTILFFMSYYYVIHGSFSDLLFINPEELNDTKLISSILNH